MVKITTMNAPANRPVSVLFENNLTNPTLLSGRCLYDLQQLREGFITVFTDRKPYGGHVVSPYDGYRCAWGLLSAYLSFSFRTSMSPFLSQRREGKSPPASWCSLPSALVVYARAPSALRLHTSCAAGITPPTGRTRARYRTSGPDRLRPSSSLLRQEPPSPRQKGAGAGVPWLHPCGWPTPVCPNL